MSEHDLAARPRRGRAPRRRFWRRVGVAVWLMCLSGCNQPKMRVWGIVTFDGQPVQNGTIEFIPVDGTHGPSGGGEVIDGHYDLSAAVGLNAGGIYQVLLRAFQTRQMAEPGNPQRTIAVAVNYLPLVYVQQTPLKIAVSEKAGENQYNFRIPAPTQN